MSHNTLLIKNEMAS